MKGPFTDRSDSSRITTELFWKHQSKQSCGSVASANALQQKSGAIKELLYRFTGNDDFFNNQQAICNQHCIAEAEKSILSGVALFTGDSGSFEIVNHKGNCHYQLAKPADAAWHTLDGTKAACTCIPN